MPVVTEKWTELAKGIMIFSGEEPLIVEKWLGKVTQMFPSNSPLARFRVAAAISRLSGKAEQDLASFAGDDWADFVSMVDLFYDQKVAEQDASLSIHAGTRYAGMSIAAAITKATTDFGLFVLTGRKAHMERPIIDALCKTFPEEVVVRLEVGPGSELGFKATLAKLRRAFTQAKLSTAESAKWAKDGLNQAYAVVPTQQPEAAVAIAAPVKASKAKFRQRGKGSSELKEAIISLTQSLDSFKQDFRPRQA
ncbi:hypothetical protein GGI00_001622 [Coemansia sp. RSA 2681]|nr:hypothetical protein GGI00_001622 [Coemansia sp. RSA 2681]